MTVSGKVNKMRLDHAAVWVADMEKTAKFLTDFVGWKRHPMTVAVSAEDETTGGMEAVFIDANGLWLELILPTSPGPGMEILKEKGAGAIIEINFEPDDYQATLDDMKAQDIPMFNMDGSPLGPDGGLIKEGVVHEGELGQTGQRIAYWSTELSHGTTVEIYEKLAHDKHSLLAQRDEQWKGQKPDPASPRTDHISIVVADLERTAKFYTDVMGLKRHARFSLNAGGNRDVGGMEAVFIDGNGVWVELFQPAGPGPLMDYLQQKGDGYVAEICAEVDDIEAYYDVVKARGVELVNLDGKPFTGGRKCFTLDPYGDKGAYFPTSASCGMVIEVYQRGPQSTSILHKRDDSWKKS
ncbi:MAG: VOC family protein [Gammaproteobacteria bacterium]|nr:VOC family protein [Gammaproteobacteria bacterium]